MILAIIAGVFDARDLAGARQEESGRRARVVVSLILVAAAALRFYRIGHFSYWLDEILETYLVRESWPGLWRTLSWQAFNAPLDYSVLKLLEALHPSDAVRRIPAAIWGVGCVSSLGALLTRRAGRAAGWAAAGLLAIAPYHVHYSQEVRPYSLGLFLLAASLLSLERFLEKPTASRFLVVFSASLATMYALYLATLLLAVTAAALVLEDAFDPDPRRRSTARSFVKWSPLYAAALALAYVPWWPVILRVLRSSPMSQASPWGWNRIARWISYFGFGSRDWEPLGPGGILFAILVAAGGILALKTSRLRFLLVWGFAGLALIEILEYRKPTYDSIFHSLPAGLGMTALAGVALGRFLSGRSPALARIAVAAFVLLFDGRSLLSYFREGRPDWRPLAERLASTPAAERIYVANQYTQLCLGYYIVGPDWLCCKRADQRPILNVEGDASKVAADWDRTRPAWLVFPGGETFRVLDEWSAKYSSERFPSAEGEGGVILRHLIAPP
jgi:dolichyl-phosphate-mannose-protein mannosyltransferase